MSKTPKNRNMLTRLDSTVSPQAVSNSSRSPSTAAGLPPQSKGKARQEISRSPPTPGSVAPTPSGSRIRKQETGTHYSSPLNTSPTYNPDKSVAKSYQSEEEEVTVDQIIKIDYSVDYDIKKVDTYMRKYFSLQSSKIPELKDQIKTLAAKLDKPLSISSEIRIENEIKELKALIERLDSAESYKRYQADTYHLIQKYESISRNEDAYSEKQCEKVVDAYFRAASKYTTMSITKELPSKTECICGQCGTDLTVVNQSITGYKTCPNKNCKVDNFVLKHVNVVKEYDTWGNFLKAFNRHTGVTYMNPNAVKFNIKDLMKSLDKYSKEKGKPRGKHYRKLQLNSKGRKDGTSQEFICQALCHLKYKDFYKDYMYICHHYYGWEYPKLKHLLGTIERNFKKKQEVWKQLTEIEKGGQSSLPTQYRLYREFQHVGYDCDESDFRLAEKTETLNRHDKVYAIMCERSNIPYPHKQCDSGSDTSGSDTSEDCIVINSDVDES